MYRCATHITKVFVNRAVLFLQCNIIHIIITHKCCIELTGIYQQV